MMTQKEMLKGLSSIIHLNQLCEGCLVGKQLRKSFLEESTSKASQPLQKIHTYICGPIKPYSFDKKRIYSIYFLFMISIKSWLYFLKEKYCHLATCDPIVFEEAINDEKWRIVTDEEIALIEKNNTWKLVPRTKQKKLIGVKLIYKEKKCQKKRREV